MTDRMADTLEARSATFFFRGQLWHLLALLALVALTWRFSARQLGDGSWLGVTDLGWFWLSIGLAILHQVLVWLVWRAQLGWSLLTRLFGRRDLTVWGAMFLPLLLARPLLLLALALSDAGSLGLSRTFSVPLGLLLLIPAVYTLFSVVRYFGVDRALGGDHFRPGYRRMPMVREGAFRWSSNAMYVFAFLGLWSIPFLVDSKAALSVALFQHVYIWVHYFCTEQPDMQIIYR